MRGVPLTPAMGSPQDMLNNPYLLDLSRNASRGALANGAVDNAFTPAELERSAALQRRRFAHAAGPPGGSAQSGWDKLAITNSANVGHDRQLRSAVAQHRLHRRPPPNCPEARTAQANGIPLFPTNAIDLLVTALGGPNATLTADNSLTANHPNWVSVAKQVQIMLSPDLLAGKRMDINRAFGNGRDDPIGGHDGIIDDALEAAPTFGTAPAPVTTGVQETAWYASASADTSPAGPLPSQFTVSGLKAFSHSNGMDANFDGHVYTDNSNGVNLNDELLARQLLARQLYVLAMLLVDQTATTAPNMILYDTTANPNQTAYALAQWAINCVDFRDRDSIMTPFEFDINPFNGWGVDGVVGTADDGHRASGAGLGLRAAGTADHRNARLARPANRGSCRRRRQSECRRHRQQFRSAPVPQDRLFIELYNPWHTNYSSANATGTTYPPSPAEIPGEFYYDAGPFPRDHACLGLAYRSAAEQDRRGHGQVAGVADDFRQDRRAIAPPDPDEPTGNFALSPTNIDRVVYFTPTSVTQYPLPAVMTSGGAAYFTSQTTVAPLMPGNYAVVGSSAQYFAGTGYVSKIGMEKATTVLSPVIPAGVNNTRRIVLNPGATGNQVSMYLNTQPGTSMLPAEPSPIAGGSATTGDVQPAVSIVIDTPRSLAISDPPGGYPAVTPPELRWNAGGRHDLRTRRGQRQPTGELVYSTVNGTPFDLPGTPQGSDGTTAGFAYVYLQRLANPQFPWNPATTDLNFGSQNLPGYPVNPYLTVDSMSIDITSFNGVAKTADPTVPVVTTANNQFRSTQRGDQYFNSAGSAVSVGAGACLRSKLAARLTAPCCGRTSQSTWLGKSEERPLLRWLRAPSKSSTPPCSTRSATSTPDMAPRARRRLGSRPARPRRRSIKALLNPNVTGAPLRLVDLEQPALHQPHRTGAGPQDPVVAVVGDVHQCRKRHPREFSLRVYRADRGGSPFVSVFASAGLSTGRHGRQRDHSDAGSAAFPNSRLFASPLSVREHGYGARSVLDQQRVCNQRHRQHGSQRGELWRLLPPALQSCFQLPRSGPRERQHDFRSRGLERHYQWQSNAALGWPGFQPPRI